MVEKNIKYILKKSRLLEVVEVDDSDGELLPSECVDIGEFPASKEQRPLPKKYWIRHIPSGQAIYDISAKQARTFVDLTKDSELCHFVMGQMEEKGAIIDAEEVVPRKSRHELGGGEGEPTQALACVDAKHCDPEADTCRIYFDCGSIIDLCSFFENRSSKGVCSVERTLWRDEEGKIQERITNEWRKDRCDMHYSSWGTMLITLEDLMMGKGKNRTVRKVLCFEYSVAKYYGMSNGLNTGLEPTAELILHPCLKAMDCIGIMDFAYSKTLTFKTLMQWFFDTAELRRLDLSLNFKVPDGYSPREYIDVLRMCTLNQQKATPYEQGSISFGCENSPYRCIFYDKTTEQKKYFNKKDASNTPEAYEDKKTFYNNNVAKLHNILRYEIQFGTKFFKERGIMTQNSENIDNCIRLATLTWRYVLNHFNEQLGRGNFIPNEDGSSIDYVLGRFEDLKNQGVFTDRQYYGMSAFMVDCFKHSCAEVRKKMSQQSFSYKYNWVKKNLNYDLKMDYAEALPIMRIMQPRLWVDYKQRIINTFRLVPAPIYSSVAI